MLLIINHSIHMKTIRKGLLTVCICGMSVLPLVTTGQTITINSISATTFCTGDSISVTFTASASWEHKNAFTVQLSDQNGAFGSGFSNIGSIQDTIGGKITINALIPNVPSSSLYRMRVLGAIPYTVSANNGSDLTISAQIPTSGISRPLYLFTNDTISFSATILGNPTSTRVHWDFGSNAVPPVTDSTLEPKVVFLSSGTQTISITSTNLQGCAVTKSQSLYFYGCDASIPKDAIVVDSGTAPYGTIYWVNPGVTFHVDGGNHIFFVEPGATVSTSGGGNIIYLKKGASFLGSDEQDHLLYEEGASFPSSYPNHNGVHQCHSLTFDYTNAPPNKAFQLNSVKEEHMLDQITVLPNPTRGSIILEHVPPNTISISLLSILGNTVMEIPSPYAENISMDLSKLEQALYYVRLVTPFGIITKKIIRQ
jgi:hypothetical protein